MARRSSSVEQLILDLYDPLLREEALSQLSKKKDVIKDLAVLLWNSWGTMAILMQEIVSIYPFLPPQTLSMAASTRACNALTLLHAIASHSETQIPFVNAYIPTYIYPLIDTTSKAREFEFLRLTGLGVIGALVKNDSPEVIQFLLQTQMFPICLKVMDRGAELSKTVATFIVMRILLDDLGLAYVCTARDKFFAMNAVLRNMVLAPEQPSVRLLKHIIRCYHRLSENQRACIELQKYLPDMLRNGAFNRCLSNDQGTTILMLQQLLINVAGANFTASAPPV